MTNDVNMVCKWSLTKAELIPGSQENHKTYYRFQIRFRKWSVITGWGIVMVDAAKCYDFICQVLML